MTQRKIDPFNLYLDRFGGTNENLSTGSMRKIRTYAEKKYNKKFTNIQQLAKFLNKNKIVAQRELVNEYNHKIEKDKNSFRELSNIKIEPTNYDKSILAKRSNLTPITSTHNNYKVYSIPSYDDKITERNIILGDNTVYNVMSVKQVVQYANMILSYIRPTLKSSLNELKSMRGFVVIHFKCFNQQTNEKFILPMNIGRVDFTSHNEFRKYFIEKMKNMLEIIKAKSYIIPYGFGEVYLNTLKYNPLRGSSYSELPDFVKNSKSIINIKNTDDKCFLWCAIASRHLPAKHTDRVIKYKPFLGEFKYDDKDFPMPFNKIEKFEKANNLTVNVFTVDEKVKIPIRLSKYKSDEVINLFYYNNHYSLIKNFQRFIGGDHENICVNCLKSYRNRECYDKHIAVCKELNDKGSFITTPKEGTFTYFNNYKKQKRLPVIMIADFESSLIETNKTTKNGIETEKSYIKSAHKANSYRIKVISDIPLPIGTDYTYFGEDSAEHFIKTIIGLDEDITEHLRELNELNKEPKLTEKEEKEFQKATKCYFCRGSFNPNDKKGDEKNDWIKVRDHDHFTGKYCGASHQKCNVKAIQMIKGKIEIPCFFHNANYDIRCFINAFAKYSGDGVERISGVPCNMEFFKCLQLNNICIKDSFAHLSSSLDKLIKNLPEEEKVNLKTIGTNEAQKALIGKKGFYPYEFIDDIEKINMPITELKQKHFDNKLTLSKISDEDWEHIQKVIKTFNIKTFKEYHDLYLKIDVYGLADVFEYHRKLSLNTYGLDPAHYLGLPALSWDAGLKLSKVKLENINDLDMVMFFEKMKRGGISVISGRHAKANNPYLPDYDAEKVKSYILQLDCNNLYGWAMKQSLPVGDFKWVENFDINTYNPNGETGYVLEVDLKYPEELHDLHNDYPLAPEHLEINKCRKLCPNLRDKKNYYIYIDNLRYYLEKGLILEKIHRVIGFTRSNWINDYIDTNSALRQKATNDFEKDFYKLMNNAFYGKTMENERDRVNIQFCMDAKSFEKHTSSPLFANQILVIKTDGLSLVKTHKKTVKLQKPIYTGAIILELSKLLMFQFHYDTMMKVYPNAEMMKTDTDSLLYYIKTEDVYEEMFENKQIQEKIEFSNYPKNHLLYNCDRKKIPGLFQDECVDGEFVVISEYIGLRAKSYVNKLYAPTAKEYAEKKKSKGVPSIHIKKRIDFNDYNNCLFNEQVIKLNGMTSFRSIGLNTYTIEMNKIALSYKDDKRIIMPDKIHTYAYGHYKTKKN